MKYAVVKKDSLALNGGFNLNFDCGLEYKSAEYQDPQLALKDFNLNKNGTHDKILRSFVDGTMNNFDSNINSTYGHKSVNNKETLWILEAKNEEEQSQMEVLQAVKSLSKTMTADEPIVNLKSNKQPLIEYFDSLKTKYVDDSKPARKMRFFAYYNLPVIYLLLDEPEKTIVEAENLILNDFDKADGKELINRANRLNEDFKIAKTTSRHNPTLK